MNSSTNHRRQEVQQIVKNACDQLNAEGVDARNYVEQTAHKLNATEFSAFPIRIPSTIKEQEIIADRLDAIETFSNQVRREISLKSHEVEELRKAVLRKAFTREL